MNNYKAPTNSKIHIESKDNELFITLPYRVASNWDKFSTIMLPIIHTSKEDYLISPQYDTFGSFLSPLELRLLMT
jgi:hypothetical protein